MYACKSYRVLSGIKMKASLEFIYKARSAELPAAGFSLSHIGNGKTGILKQWACGLFNDAVSSSGYIVWNDRMISE
jgi:hypothetical protein